MAALALVCATTLASAAPAHAGRIDGISDQRIEQWSAQDEQFAGQLRPKYARRVVSWDVMSRPDELAKVDAWLSATARMGLKQLISFGWPDPANTQNIPSFRAYRTSVAAFVNTHPSAREYTAFNEAGHYSDKISPGRAARYYVDLRTICHRWCTVAAADFNPVPTIKTYLPAYREALKRRKAFPRIWALHPYEGSVSISEVRKLLPRKSRLWLTESALIAGPNQENDAHGLLKEKAERTYVYQLSRQGSSSGSTWDSGLLDEHGHPRPAFHILRNRSQG